MLEFMAGEGKHTVRLWASLTGDGLIVQLMGGEKPHVGAVTMSLPRPSLSRPGGLSASTTVVPRLGHMEDMLAREIGERICKAIGEPVVVVAGLHLDNAGPGDISLLLNNSRLAADKFLAGAGYGESL